jgi:hypothetical protein
MSRLSRIAARGRTIPWLAVLDALRRIKRCYDVLSPNERREVGDLMRKARAQRGRLSERDRRRVMQLGRKCVAAAARKR